METDSSGAMENLAVGVVTHNRLELLKRLIDSFRKQTVKPDRIYIVNNASTDGTETWLNQQVELFDDIEVIKQENSGSSGGQHTNLKTMFEAGYEWIWVMDDDVVPTTTCLENLTDDLSKNEVRVPMRYDIEGKPYFQDVIDLNLTNPFKTIWTKIIDESFLNNDTIQVDGVTFEGALFHRSIIERIGYPEKPFFIYFDDTEYMIRVKKAGGRCVIHTNARLDKALALPTNKFKFTWKHYHLIKNLIAIDVLHGNIGVRLLRPFGYFIKWLGRSKNISDILTTIKALFKGYFYISKNK